jgi:hypothetical protein
LAGELHDTSGVSDTLWSVFSERFSDDQLLDTERPSQKV